MKLSQYLQNNDNCMKMFSEYKYYWELLRPNIDLEQNKYMGAVAQPIIAITFMITLFITMLI